jgi:hypothetical protein
MTYKVAFKPNRKDKPVIVDVVVNNIKELYHKLSDKRLGTILSVKEMQNEYK